MNHPLHMAHPAMVIPPAIFGVPATYMGYGFGYYPPANFPGLGYIPTWTNIPVSYPPAYRNYSGQNMRYTHLQQRRRREAAMDLQSAHGYGYGGAPGAPKSFGIPWGMLLGGLGGAALAVKTLGINLKDGILRLGVLAAATLGGVFLGKLGSDTLDAYGRSNPSTQRYSPIGHHSMLVPPGDLDRAFAQYRSGATPADKPEDISLPAQAPFTPTVAKNEPKLPNKPTAYRA